MRVEGKSARTSVVGRAKPRDQSLEARRVARYLICPAHTNVSMVLLPPARRIFAFPYLYANGSNTTQPSRLRRAIMMQPPCPFAWPFCGAGRISAWAFAPLASPLTKLVLSAAGHRKTFALHLLWVKTYNLHSLRPRLQENSACCLYVVPWSKLV